MNQVIWGAGGIGVKARPCEVLPFLIWVTRHSTAKLETGQVYDFCFWILFWMDWERSDIPLLRPLHMTIWMEGEDNSGAVTGREFGGAATGIYLHVLIPACLT